jgi:SPP1 family predicted phage head-tail adaptor
MRAGELRESINLEAPTPQNEGQQWGATGAAQYTTVYSGIRASVIADAEAETVADHAVMTATTFTVRIRWLRDITNTWRVIWGSRVLDIVSVIDPTGRKRELVIKAVENVSNG